MAEWCKKSRKVLAGSGKSTIFAAGTNPIKHMKTIKVEVKREGLSMTMDREDFAMALKTWRLRQGLTQREVAQQWGVSRWTIIRIERAENISWTMAYRVFARLAEALKEEGTK